MDGRAEIISAIQGGIMSVKGWLNTGRVNIGRLQGGPVIWENVERGDVERRKLGMTQRGNHQLKWSQIWIVWREDDWVVREACESAVALRGWVDGERAHAVRLREQALQIQRLRLGRPRC